MLPFERCVLLFLKIFQSIKERHDYSHTCYSQPILESMLVHVPSTQVRAKDKMYVSRWTAFT